MVGGQRDVARLAGDLVQLERGGEGRAHDRHVGLAGQQAGVGVGEGEVADLELDLGVALGERAQQPRRRGQAGGRAQAYGEASGRAVGVLSRGGDGEVDRGQRLACARQEVLARRGQPHLARGALEEPGADQRLELGHARAERLLHDVDAARRRA